MFLFLVKEIDYGLGIYITLLTKLNKYSNDLAPNTRRERLCHARLGVMPLVHSIMWSFAESREGGSLKMRRDALVVSPFL